jgi:hypothetical protein
MFQTAQRAGRSLYIIISGRSAGGAGADRKVLMNPYTNRWTVSLAWLVGMLIVWSLFVPRSVSVTTFFLLVAIGLVISMFGASFLKDGQPPRSVGAIIGDLEARSPNDARAGLTGSDDRRR